jgi:cytochrome c oxidase subunit 3
MAEIADIQQDISPPPSIDVSHLPTSAFDWRAPVWWGNTLAILIETTTMVLLIATYFYLRRNFGEWPPNNPDVLPPLYHHDALPDLKFSTINTILIAAACLPMYWTDLRARRKDAAGVRIGLVIMLLLAAVAIVLRFYEFPGLKFKWNTNAYGSVLWWILGMHLTYLIAAALEFFIMALWVFLHPIDDNHALDVTLAGGYWYWLAGVWVVVYFVVYFGARVL